MKIALIGAGSWGTAVAGLVADSVDSVAMWAHSPQTADAITSTPVTLMAIVYLITSPPLRPCKKSSMAPRA